MWQRLKTVLLAAPEGRREPPPEILYGLDQRPPLGMLAGSAVQHAFVALMFTFYAVLAARGAGLEAAAASGFVALVIVVMGVTTLLQSAPTRLGPGRLLVHIPSPLALAAFVAVVHTNGLAAAAGGMLLAAAVIVVFGRALPHLRPVFPPEVSGVVVVLLGIALVEGGAPRFIGFTPENGADGTAAMVAGATLAAIVALSVWGRGRAKVFAVIGGVAAGIAVALLTTDFATTATEAVAAQPLFALPGAGYDLPWPSLVLSAAIPIIVVELLGVLDLLGTVIAIDRMDNTAWRRPDMRMIGRGVGVQAFSTALSGLTGTITTGTSTANLGLAHASGLTSRSVGVVAGLLLVACAFTPALPALLVVIPDPVIGAMTIYAGGYMLVAGAELILSRMLNARRTFVVGLGLAVGIAIMMHPQLAAGAPEALKPVLGSGLATGSLVAIVLNLLFRLGVRRRAATLLEGDDLQHQATRFLEVCGGDWGARRDVVTRAGVSVGEAIEAIRLTAGQHGAITMTASFDEFNLHVELSYEGRPLTMSAAAPASAEDLAALLDGDDDSAIDLMTARLSDTLITQLADKVRSHDRDGRAVLVLHFNH